MDTHMETGMKEHLQLVERYAEELKHEKESAEDAMIIEVLSAKVMNYVNFGNAIVSTLTLCGIVD